MECFRGAASAQQRWLIHALPALVSIHTTIVISRQTPIGLARRSASLSGPWQTFPADEGTDNIIVNQYYFANEREATARQESLKNWSVPALWVKVSGWVQNLGNEVEGGVRHTEAIFRIWDCETRTQVRGHGIANKRASVRYSRPWRLWEASRQWPVPGCCE